MSKLRIKDAPLLPNVDGTEKIPTGGKGDYSVSIEQLKVFAQGGLPQQLQDHINDSENPHNVTKDQVGLGNVDNTNDVNKPISTLTQEALNLKADQTYVDEELNFKANSADVDAALVLKASKSYVDNQDSSLQSQINQKATASYVDSALAEQTQTVNTALSQLSTAATKFYPTKSVAEADIANIAVNQPVQVGESGANGGLWYKATAGATTLTKSAYDPLTQAKNYTDSYATVKAKTLANSTDFNTLNVEGRYIVPSNAAALTMLNCPSPYAGVLEVVAVNSNYLFQRYSPSATNAKLYFRILANGVWSNWDSYLSNSMIQSIKDPTPLADATDFNTVVVAGNYKVISNLSATTMLNSPSTRAGVLEVLPVNATLVIQRYTPYGIEKKSYIRAYNSSWNAWDELLFKSEALSLFATPAYVGSSVSSSLDAITQSDFYGKKYTESEQSGSSLYQNGVIVGLNSIHSKTIDFNSISARIFNPTNSAIEYRIWTGSKTVSGGNGFGVSGQVNIGSPDFFGTVQSLPKSDTGEPQNIVLDKSISIPANTPFVIAFKAVDNTKFGIAYASAQTGNLEARSFNLSQLAADWSSQTAIGNATFASGYVQAGFKLLIEIPQSSSGAQPDAHIPELVLPPKLYAMQRTKVDTEPKIDQTLETRIYPEHLLVEDYKLYEHDITCNRGQQRNRGFVWSATQNDPVGSYPLTWTLHDKQKGNQLAAASTAIQLAALNAKSGQTVKALVIGDSLVNAGFITQRLLDIAADDVMKVSLIGTRGTGLNKHEGRGGWKIADYAGAGQSNYKFTVSGVTTSPAINSTTYTYSGRTFLMQEVSISGGSGYVVASLTSGSAPTLGASGILTKANSGVGDATIAFSDIEALPTNPFWNTSTSQLDFANYLSYNSLATPDYVFIQLGVNDVFGLTSDQAVIDFTATAFAQLDSIIAAIKAAMPLAKIAVVAPPVGANQDAFGTSYGCGQTAWRYRRNLVTYNKQLYAHYSGKEAQSIYVLGSGVGVDTENNFPTAVKTINSHNSKTEDAQSNGVHPDKPGYDQLSDGLFPFMKVV